MARYKNNIEIKKLDNGKRYYSSVIPEDYVPRRVEYTHEARVGDRWDTIAYKYLGNAALWYTVANANGGLNGSIFIKPGTIIVIPEN